MTPRLISIWLCESWSDVEPLEQMGPDNRAGVDVDATVDLTRGLEVRLELGFSVSGPDSEPLCAVSGTFRLLYESATLPQSQEQAAELAATFALTDTWPVWRAWLHGQLAAMGLPPSSLPARVPRFLRDEVRRATDLVGPA